MKKTIISANKFIPILKYSIDMTSDIYPANLNTGSYGINIGEIPSLINIKNYNKCIEQLNNNNFNG